MMMMCVCIWISVLLSDLCIKNSFFESVIYVKISKKTDIHKMSSSIFSCFPCH